MREAHLARVTPLEAALLAEDALHAGVVVLGVEAEVVRPDAVVPVVAEAGQRARLLAHVVLGVAAVGAEREQLHQLARVVLVRRVLPVLRSREPQQHRRVARDPHEQVVGTSPSAFFRSISFWWIIRRCDADAVVRRREPVVPDERHALGQRPVRAEHPVEPPQVVVSPRVGRRQRVAVLVVGRRAAEPLLPARPRERVDRAVEALPRKLLGLAGARAEPGPPQQALGLLGAEAAPVDATRPAPRAAPAPALAPRAACGAGTRAPLRMR